MVKKLFTLIKSPVVLILSLTIPVVDEDDPDGQGWCQYLHAIQIAFSGKIWQL